MARTIVLLNSLLYLCVVALGGRDIYMFIFRHALSSVFSEMLAGVVVIRLFYIVPSVVGIFGLLLAARWARSFALSWNLGLAFMIGAIPFLSAALVAYPSEVDFKQFLPRGASLVFLLAASGTFLLMAAGLRSGSVLQYFKAHA